MGSTDEVYGITSDDDRSEEKGRCVSGPEAGGGRPSGG